MIDIDHGNGDINEDSDDYDDHDDRSGGGGPGGDGDASDNNDGRNDMHWTVYIWLYVAQLHIGY